MINTVEPPTATIVLRTIQGSSQRTLLRRKIPPPHQTLPRQTLHQQPVHPLVLWKLMAPFHRTNRVPFKILHPLSAMKPSFPLLAARQTSTSWRPVMFQLIRPHRLIPAHLFQPKMNQSLRISGFLGGVLKLVQSTEYQALYRSRRHIPSSWTRGTFQQLATATWKCGATATTSIQQIVVLTMKRKIEQIPLALLKAMILTTVTIRTGTILVLVTSPGCHV
ncbi:hypothetical protein PENNAL_c0264G10992 [Penicillium nalgiovense]|uniref:Uncharacterized protein n=1 Tax=Penicillium nalgiovense TaxID=60175 RepID=A0A1V6WIF5_PENNA|nr:hypothetical protein PENNAL_c0264G10992 [Penicillium nalgiovense]